VLCGASGQAQAAQPACLSFFTSHGLIEHYINTIPFYIYTIFLSQKKAFLGMVEAMFPPLEMRSVLPANPSSGTGR